MTVLQQMGKVIEELQISQGIISVGLIMCRILGMIWLNPFLGGKLVPNQVRIGVSLALGLVIYPVVQLNGGMVEVFNPSGPSYPFALRIMGLLVKEIFVGFVLGFIMLTVWHAVEMAGRFIDTARGSSMAQAQVPEMKARVTLIGNLYYQLLIVVFLATGGHHIFLYYFFRSYQLIPVAGVPRFDTGLWPFFELVIRITAELFFLAITLAAPVMVAIFVTDVCMGLFNKVAPQINVLFLMMPFKAVLGIFFCMLSLYLFMARLGEYTALTLRHLRLIIQYLTPF